MKQCKSFFLMTGLLLAGFSSSSQSEIFANADKVAIGGYDLVAYHTANEAVRGNKANSSTRDGVTYYFSSAVNQNAFQENPSRYLPKYGGYCAFAMAMKGAKAPSDPSTFKIRDGKLFLFFNDYYEGKPFNTVIPWNADEQAMMTKAEANWKKQ